MKLTNCIVFTILLASLPVVDAQSEPKAVAVYAVRPKYGRGMPEGRGFFKLTLDDTGKVLSVSVVKSTGHSILDQGAIAAFRQWRFKPGTAHTVTMPMEFFQQLPPRLQRAARPK